MNWKEEITKIDPDIKFRAQGGWLKTVEELDKSVTNGYSLVGDFVKAGDFEGEYLEGIYLDCNKEGSAKKPQTDYAEFLGKSGNTGLSTGPHLHWEVRLKGEAVNPLYFVDKFQRFVE